MYGLENATRARITKQLPDIQQNHESRASYDTEGNDATTYSFRKSVSRIMNGLMVIPALLKNQSVN